MFDGSNDDDDAFFTPVPSSKLASLFGVSVTQVNISPANTSLTYTAPKQPVNKPGESGKILSKTKHQSSVIIFKEVHAFKLVEKNYLNQGKCGLALIGNDTVHIYQLLLYKQKNDIISSTKIAEKFQFVIQKDNYSSYCDDQKQNWTIHFNSELDLNEFSSTLESRGSKLVKVKEYATNEHSILSNLKPIEIKNTLDMESPKQTESDNNSDNSSSNVKANILSRMAKMGQKMLPNTSISDGTDSETEREKAMYNKNRKIKHGTTTSPTTGINSSPEVSNQPVNVISSRSNSGQTPYLKPIPQQYAMINGQPVQITPTQIGSTYQSVLSVENISSPVTYTQLIPPSYDQLQMYFSENRTHNSEVRMNILRLTNKMEEVLEKVYKLDTNIEKGNSTTDESEFNALKEENENLKSSIAILKNNTEICIEYEKKNKELLKKEQKLVEENDELKKEIQQYVINENKYKEKINELEIRIKDNETSVVNTKADGDKLIDKRNEKVEVSIKKTMNSLYFEITDKIQDYDTIQGKDVKRILAQKIRDNTYSIISAVSDLNSSK